MLPCAYGEEEKSEKNHGEQGTVRCCSVPTSQDEADTHEADQELPEAQSETVVSG